MGLTAHPGRNYFVSGTNDIVGGVLAGKREALEVVRQAAGKAGGLVMAVLGVAAAALLVAAAALVIAVRARGARA